MTPWTAAWQVLLSSSASWSLLKSLSIELVMLSKHLILCCPFSFCLQSFSASGSFPMSQLFGGQTTGASVSATLLPVNIQSWFPLGLVGLISLLSKRLSRPFSSTTVWRHQFFGVQPSLITRYVLLPPNSVHTGRVVWFISH